MATWDFYLVLDGPEVTDEDVDVLYEAGCDDASIVSRNGVTYMAFDREADSLEAAIGSAVGEVLNAGYLVGRAEVEDPEQGEGAKRVVWATEELVQEELRDYFCHFVALSGCYHQIDSSGNPTDYAGAFHYSGFILEIKDQWYWVTAAHVFYQDDDEGEGIETLRRKGKIEIDECALNDSFTVSKGAWKPIPFRYWDYERVTCYDKAQGLDIFAVKLRRMYRNLLEANGVVAISESNWQPREPCGLDGFLLLGVPAELEDTKVTPESDGYHVRTKPAPAAVYVTRVEEVPADCIKPNPRFVGKVEKKAGNIIGMSGGPVIGICKDDPKHYLVAVQSSRSRTRPGFIFGCPAAVLVQKVLEEEQE